MGTLSSSIPTIGLDPSLKVVELVATIVVKFLEAWEKIGKIREMRAEMTDMGITGPPVEHLTKTIKTTIDEVVEESTEIVLMSYTTVLTPAPIAISSTVASVPLPVRCEHLKPGFHSHWYLSVIGLDARWDSELKVGAAHSPAAFKRQAKPNIAVTRTRSILDGSQPATRQAVA